MAFASHFLVYGFVAFSHVYRILDRLDTESVAAILMHPQRWFCLYTMICVCVPRYHANLCVWRRACVVIWKTARKGVHNKTGWWSVAGWPAKQSADKSQDKFLMQSSWGCWMLQRKQRVFFSNFACLFSVYFETGFWSGFFSLLFLNTVSFGICICYIRNSFIFKGGDLVFWFEFYCNCDLTHIARIWTNIYFHCRCATTNKTYFFIYSCKFQDTSWMKA